MEEMERWEFLGKLSNGWLLYRDEAGNEWEVEPEEEEAEAKEDEAEEDEDLYTIESRELAEIRHAEAIEINRRLR